MFDAIMESIASPADPWMVAADFRSFIEAQRRAAALYQDAEAGRARAS